ncbi:hypothetical protein PQX77_011517, partial [Marasmius sp. AFHP31]
PLFLYPLSLFASPAGYTSTTSVPFATAGQRTTLPVTLSRVLDHLNLQTITWPLQKPDCQLRVTRYVSPTNSPPPSSGKIVPDGLLQCPITPKRILQTPILHLPLFSTFSIHHNPYRRPARLVIPISERTFETSPHSSRVPTLSRLPCLDRNVLCPRRTASHSFFAETPSSLQARDCSPLNSFTGPRLGRSTQHSAAPAANNIHGFHYPASSAHYSS